MVDLTKPCVKCEVVDRSKRGDCKNCRKKSAAKYRVSDHGRAKREAYQRKYRQSEEALAKERARERKYRQSEKGRAKRRDRRLNDFKDVTKRQKTYAVELRRKKLNFEFSLQKQQKVIEQCQQKLTQPNEIR